MPTSPEVVSAHTGRPARGGGTGGVQVVVVVVIYTHTHICNPKRQIFPGADDGEAPRPARRPRGPCCRQAVPLSQPQRHQGARCRATPPQRTGARRRPAQDSWAAWATWPYFLAGAHWTQACLWHTRVTGKRRNPAAPPPELSTSASRQPRRTRSKPRWRKRMGSQTISAVRQTQLQAPRQPRPVKYRSTPTQQPPSPLHHDHATSCPLLAASPPSSTSSLRAGRR